MDLDEIKELFGLASKKLTINEANSIVSAAFDNEIAIDMADRFHGSFFYEIVPLVRIANALGNSVSHLKYEAQSKRYDGLIFFSDGGTVRVEISAAIDGYNDALQMELLAERGHAPAYQKIDASGRKGNRIFGRNEATAYQSSEYIEHKLIPRVKATISNKVGKASRNIGYEGAWLGIVFDDYFQPDPNKKRLLLDPAFSECLSQINDSRYPFARTFFIGISGEYFFDCEVNKTNSD